MLLQFISNLLSLNIPWFVELALNNLFYLFAFYAVMHIFMAGKGVLNGFVVLCLMIWFWMDFAALGGAVLFVGGFLAFYYISKMALLILAEATPQLKQKLIIVSELQFIGAFVLYNLYFV
jgi:hypothetical protein